MTAEDPSVLVCRFIEAQEPLPPCMLNVLHASLWDLYESDQPKVGAVQSVPNSLGRQGEKVEWLKS